MSDVWHGQVIDRVESPGICRLDIWVYEMDRAVLVATDAAEAPAVGALVRAEELKDAVAIQVVPEAAWPSDLTPLIPTSPGDDHRQIMARSDLDNDSGEVGQHADGSDPRRM